MLNNQELLTDEHYAKCKQAEFLLEQSLTVEVFEFIADDLKTKWALEKDPDNREALWYQLQNLDALLVTFQALAATKKMVDSKNPEVETDDGLDKTE